ncbi:MAG TPA: NAD+ synthase [Fimbriimonadaceae bacterium]|nr:NAD+ synthase [Fimbriimonadaceae bacterium]HRJ33021.1 NAD+ synthase [Fimbriimonadaceae bacterium]
MAVPVVRAESFDPTSPRSLRIHTPLVKAWLVAFLRDEVQRRRKMDRVVLGLSGGVDSAVVAYLAAEAFGPENVLCLRLPYRLSSKQSLDHARLVVEALGVQEQTLEITSMVEGYLGACAAPVDPVRIGNICARCRMIAIFDHSMAIRGLPLGTGNKTERLLGYFTWHADDAPPINPLGDLYKTQVWQLAQELGVPSEIIEKPPTADLIEGQTDEGDFGISYERADRILEGILRGFSSDQLAGFGFTSGEIALVRKRLDSTHWKRRLPTVAMMSTTSIGEYYLRPVDY